MPVTDHIYSGLLGTVKGGTKGQAISFYPLSEKMCSVSQLCYQLIKGGNDNKLRARYYSLLQSARRANDCE